MAVRLFPNHPRVNIKCVGSKRCIGHRAGAGTTMLQPGLSCRWQLRLLQCLTWNIMPGALPDLTQPGTRKANVPYRHTVASLPLACIRYTVNHPAHCLCSFAVKLIATFKQCSKNSVRVCGCVSAHMCLNQYVCMCIYPQF